MPNVRFITSNLAIGATLRNGSGGGTGAKSEDADYPMTNALHRDRYKIWRSAQAVASPFYYDYDLGASKTIRAAAVHGLRATSGITAISSVKFYYGAAEPANIQLGSTITSPAITSRDLGVDHGSNVSGRYIRVEFTTTGSGRLEVGVMAVGALTDVGSAPSPGAADTPILGSVLSRTANGLPIFYSGGDAGRLFDMGIEKASRTMGDALETAHAVGLPITYFDLDNQVWQVYFQGLRRERLTAPSLLTGVEAISLQMARMP